MMEFRVVDQEELDDMGETRRCDHDIFDQKQSVLKISNRKQNLPSRWTRDRYLTRSICNAKTDTVEDKKIRVVVNALCELDPKNFGEAMMSQRKHKWMTAVSEEVNTLGKKGIKMDANGDVEQYKARLVACGNENLFGVHYTLTFAVVCSECMCQSRKGIAFGRLHEVLKIDEMPLKRYGVNYSIMLALLMKKSLYGLKQAGRLWSKLLQSRLCEARFTQCTTDMCLYFKKEKDELTILGAYVDDLLVTGTFRDAVDKFFKEMSALEIKDLVVVNKFLGLRISLNEEVGYVLDQDLSIDLLLKEYGLETTNGVRTSAVDEFDDCNSQEPEYLPLTSTNGNATVEDFQSLLGRLLWIARCTRPDICFAVHRVTRQTHKPTMDYLKMAKRISRYLKGTKMLKLQIGGVGVSYGDVKIESWSDAGLAADQSDRKSFSGCVVMIDAEFIAPSQTGRELLGLRQLFQELGFKIAEPMKIKMDNQAAIKQLEGEKSTESAKHVNIRVKFICHYAHAQVVQPIFVKSGEIIADLLTKALSPIPYRQDCAFDYLGHVKRV
uniref:Pol polyprotein putative n=1 Tax=Albugo laibachii Nc14 TaxID=890382 RepID=F0WNZ8_9STRA|nr:pol polyprotein putative [Albugo laibachii Nc14]|eukprot:CCA23041.1 pol polyprotein putative [Albugo laibachii Nc14]